jgi:SusD family.
MKKVLIIVFVALLASCTNLDIIPNSQLTDQSSFKNKSEFINGLAGVYTTLWCWDEVVYKMGGSTDEMVFPARGADWKGDLQPLYLHTWSSSNGEISGVYTELSNIIAVSNTFIDVIDKSQFKDDSDIKVMRGETRFIRAFAYFLMCDMFGNVPLVTSATYSSSNLPQQASRADIYNFVKSELTDLKGILSATNSYGRVDKYAAEALLAKLYLNSGVYLGTQSSDDLNQVVTLANDIIANSSYSLDPSFKHVFTSYNDQNNKENMFVMVCGASTKAQNLSTGFSFFKLPEKYNSSLADGWDGCAATPSFYRSFDSNDIRTAQWVVGPQFKADGVTPIIATDDKGVSRQLTFSIDFLGADPVNNADHWDGARGGKYVMDGIVGYTSNWTLENDEPILRFADVLMMKAEAVWRLDNKNSANATALALVNRVRTRDGNNPVAALTSLTEATLLAERGRELAWEGWRRNDQIRFGTFISPKDFKTTTDNVNRNLFPIPLVQIQSNPNLKQNTGY